MVEDTRTPPLPRRTGGGLRISYSESKTTGRGQGRLAQRRTRSEGAATSGDLNKEEARKLLVFPKESITSVNAARANNSEPLRRVPDPLLPKDAVVGQSDGYVMMYEPLDCITDEMPLLDFEAKRSTVSPTSPSLHPPLLPLAASKNLPKQTHDIPMESCLNMNSFHITVEDKVHCQGIKAGPTEVETNVNCNTNAIGPTLANSEVKEEHLEEVGVRKKRRLAKKDDELSTSPIRGTTEESNKKRRGRRSSKSSKLESIVQRTCVDMKSASSENCSSSDKENVKQAKKNLPKDRVVKRGRSFKVKPSTPSSTEDELKEEVQSSRASRYGFRNKLRSSHSGLISHSPNARSLRKRTAVDWSVLRKKVNTEAQANEDKDSQDSANLTIESENKKEALQDVDGPLERTKKRATANEGLSVPEKVIKQPKNPKSNAITGSPSSPLKSKMMTSSATHMSPTFVDSDLARPSRNVVRPVRLGDQLEQAQENLAIMRLPNAGRTALPYKMDSLAWNSQHTANEQEQYCYCGATGDWYNRMVCCARCSQWFHERCLAPRPLAMPIIPGDPFWLFVCVHCNSGSECLKRMDLSWTELVHLSLFDLTLKTERKFHHFDKDLFPFFRSSWNTFQLKKHFTSLSEEERKTKLCEELARNNGTKESQFENGAESGQDSCLWGLRCLAPPPRPCYQVPNVGIIQERTVLDEVVIQDVEIGTAADTSIVMDNLNIEYNSYRPKMSKPAGACNDKLPIPPSSSQVISDKTVQGSPTTARTDVIVKTKCLHIPKQILNAQLPELMKENSKLKDKKTSNLHCQRSPSEYTEPQKRLKLLPYEISKILHQKGYPKVAMKFASIIPPKKSEVLKSVQTKDIRKTTKKKKGGITSLGKSVLDSMIPALPSYKGRDNPFNPSALDNLKASERLSCQCSLNHEDGKRLRTGKRKSSEGKNKKVEELFEDSKQVTGRFVSQSGEMKLIMTLSQTSDHDQMPSSNDLDPDSLVEEAHCDQASLEKRMSDVKKSLDKMICQKDNSL